MPHKTKKKRESARGRVSRAHNMHNELLARMPFSLYMNAAIENFKFHKMALAVIHIVVSN